MSLNYNDSNDIIKKDRLLKYFEMVPEDATIRGCHVFDAQVSGAREEDIREQRAFMRNWLSDIKKEDQSKWTPSQKLDLEVFEGYSHLCDFHFDQLREWQRNPGATDDYSSIIFLMLAYKTDNEEERFSNIAARLEHMPRLIKDYNSRIKDVPSRWRDICAEANESVPILLDAVTRGAAEKKISTKLQERIATALKAVYQSVAEQVLWLKNLKVDQGESWIIGSEKFEELLKLRRLGLDSKQILELGHEYLALSKEERAKWAKKIDTAGNISAANQIVESAHPKDFESALEIIKSVSMEARKFLIKNSLVNIPDDEEMDIVETPAFLRPTIPFAAIFTPAKFDPHQKAVYIVTNPRNKSLFKKHLNIPCIYNTTVHEGYPGHHLQMATANQKGTITRSGIFGSATDLVEGWAHYCEEMMKEQGFHDTPEGRFIMLNDQIWRACRIIIDVKLSSGEMTYEQAAQMLVDNVDMGVESAKREVNRYIQAPGRVLNYLIGKHLLKNLKAEVKKREGLNFDIARFHNNFLSYGNMPISYISREMLK